MTFIAAVIDANAFSKSFVFFYEVRIQPVAVFDFLPGICDVLAGRNCTDEVLAAS